MLTALTVYMCLGKGKYSFLKSDPTEHEAHCLDCNHNFPINNGGKSDVKKHR